jgi:pyruvate/2-oxoglutarate dehydrogenase complex dihydrolipoamide acyltransferase (E2) component
VVVAHPDGYVSRYGHLTPTDRVRPGELVHTGQVIGKMGNTGNSTGTHLHFELLRGGRDVDPLAYLPAGVIKIDKTSTRKGEQALKAKQKARQRAREKARDRREARAAAAVTAAADTAAPALAAADGMCAPVTTSEFVVDLYGFAPDAPEGLASECDGGAASLTMLEVVDPDIVPEQPVARAQPAAAALPGVPLPERGTSPVPA